MKSLIETLADARRRQVAAGHFNFSELTAFKAIVESALELKLPVMVGVSEGEREFIGVAESAALVKTAREQYGLPIFLNADHTHSLAKAVEAAKAGFDEIIFDGSALPFDKNVEETRRAVETLKSINPGIVGCRSRRISRDPRGVMEGRRSVDGRTAQRRAKSFTAFRMTSDGRADLVPQEIHPLRLP